MPVLLDINGVKVDLPWLAVHVLLKAYYDTRGSFNDTKRGDDGIQWTVLKASDSVTLQKEVDMFLIVSAKGKKDAIEADLYKATVRLRNLTSSLEVAQAANNKEVVAEFEKQLADTKALEASLTKELASLVEPQTVPEAFVFAASVDDLKFGLPDYGKPEAVKSNIKQEGK